MVTHRLSRAPVVLLSFAVALLTGLPSTRSFPGRPRIRRRELLRDIDPVAVTQTTTEVPHLFQTRTPTLGVHDYRRKDEAVRCYSYDSSM